MEDIMERFDEDKRLGMLLIDRAFVLQPEALTILRGKS